MNAAFKLTGRHVLAMLVAFFLSIFAANAVFIMLAIKSFPGEREKKSYLQGLSFNERIAAREAQDALGWNVEIARVSRANGAAVLELRVFSTSGRPVSQLALSGMLARPAYDGRDHALEFFELEPGLYRTEVSGLDAGLWRLEATATGKRGEKFTLEKRLTLE